MQIASIILAGGKSTRMGVDKGLLLYQHKPMINHVLEAAESITNDICVVTSNEKYAEFDYPLVADQISDKGPLGGIVSGMDFIMAEKYIVLSCDVPNISGQFLSEILSASENFDVCFPQKGERIHPLIGIYSRSALNHLKEQLALNQLKMTKAIAGLNVCVYNADNWSGEIFKNINSKEDLK